MRTLTVRILNGGVVVDRVVRKKGEIVVTDHLTAHALVDEGLAGNVVKIRTTLDGALIGNCVTTKGEIMEVDEDQAVLAHNLGKAEIVDMSMLSHDSTRALREPPPLPAPKTEPRSPYADEPWVKIRFLKPRDGMSVWNVWIPTSEDGTITIPKCLAEVAVREHYAEFVGPRAVVNAFLSAIHLSKAREPGPIHSV